MELINDVFYWYEHGVAPSNAANSPTVFCGIWHCPFFGGKEYKMLIPKKKKKGAGTAGVSNTLSPWAFARGEPQSSFLQLALCFNAVTFCICPASEATLDSQG